MFALLLGSQFFKIVLVILMGVGSYLYFENIKKLGFEGKYAIFTGISIFVFGIIWSLSETSMSNTIDYIFLNGKPSFGALRLFFIGYAFIIYGLMAILIKYIKLKEI